MKRSEINELMADTLAFFKEHKFALPRWAEWSHDDWLNDPQTARHVQSRQMGWDITDFGGGDFYKRGLILFCVRNGVQGDSRTVPYAEKIMVVREKQETPFHFHKVKMEDIIVRGGGELIVECCHTDEDGELLDRDVTIWLDGLVKTVKAREPIVIGTGESITLERRVSHRFYGREGTGKVLVGEVSQVNDDLTDNFFDEPIGRFSEIKEDTASLYPLWREIEINAPKTAVL